MDFDKLKIAIVYDRVNKWGGAERVLLALHKIFPKASLFTSVYNSKTAPWAQVFPCVYTSFLQKVPFAKSFHQGFGWLMPLAFESIDFDGFDLVISLTSEAAKGIITKPKTKHLCYILTPTRYLWSHHDIYFRNNLLRLLSKPVVYYLRYWDKVAAFRPDKVIAISEETKNRVERYYGIDSKVVYPPLFYNNYKVSDSSRPLLIGGVKPRDYYLVVSRLESYKRVDLAIDAFNKLKRNLLIVGGGSQLSYLKKKSGENIKFLSNLSDELLAFYYQNAKALIMPQIEDFGLVSLEAQSYFLPIIAYREGGACETVLENKTGIFFNSQDVFSLIDAIERFDKMKFSSKDFKTNLQRFSFDRFRNRLLKEVEELF